MRTFVLSMIWLFCVGATAQTQEVHIKMDSDLAELKENFNATADQLRLIYIVGPT